MILEEFCKKQRFILSRVGRRRVASSCGSLELPGQGASRDALYQEMMCVMSWSIDARPHPNMDRLPRGFQREASENWTLPDHRQPPIKALLLQHLTSIAQGPWCMSFISGLYAMHRYG